MKVGFIDFSDQYELVKDEIDTGLKSVFQKGDFVLGEEAEAFESQFSKYCQAQYGVGVNSGTDALYLALSALNIGPGDEVIVPTFTFIATALCVSYTGATPVFVDIEEQTYNIDPAKFKAAITKRTKAIIPVHIYGQSADMKEIQDICKKYNIKIVEDACQAHGSTYGGKKAGALGDLACFSFYPTKSLGAFGDAGMIVTNDKKIFEDLRMLRDYGRQGRYQHKIKGYNSRLDTIQAVVLSAKLKYLDEWNKLRQQNAQYYGQLLNKIPGIMTPKIKDNRTHVFQTYAVRMPHRDKVCKKMQENGIEVIIHYPVPLHLQEAYADLNHKKGDFPISEKICDEILSLPMYPHMRREQIERVCTVLKESF